MYTVLDCSRLASVVKEKIPWSWRRTMAKMEVDALHLNPEEDDLMDEDYEASPRRIVLGLTSAITGHSSSSLAAHLRDRGYGSWRENGVTGEDRHPMRSIEGWVIFVTGLHEETQEDDIYNAFRGFGQIKNIHLNLDHHTGYVKGYALLEYANLEEAEAAIAQMNETELLTQIINVDWAFSKGPILGKKFLKKRGTHHTRSRSPGRRF